MATITPGGSALALMEQQWQSQMKRQTNEAGRIFPTFDKPDGVQKVGSQLNISKVLRIAPTKVTSSTDTGKTLNYTNNTELNVAVTPTFAYGAAEITQMLMTRMLRSPAYVKAIRQQISSGLIAQKDADAGQLAASISVTKGGAGQNFDNAFLLSCIKTLAGNVRELWEPGTGKWAFLHFHPNQLDSILAINQIVSAQTRGDAERPVKVGWVWEAYGLAMTVSGNVYRSGGIAHNFMHIRESHIYGLNEDFRFLEDQMFEAVVRIICLGEYALAEVWDEYGVDCMTTDS